MHGVTTKILKRCLIKDDSNYVFRHIAAIIRFSSEENLMMAGIGGRTDGRKEITKLVVIFAVFAECD